MKHRDIVRIIIISFTTAAVGYFFGLNQSEQKITGSVSTSTTLPDYFAKKVECGNLLVDVQKRFAAKDDEYNRFAFTPNSATDGGEQYSLVNRICYSPKYNTCIAFINWNLYRRNKHVDWSYESFDVLTNESVKGAYKDYDNNSEFPSQDLQYNKQRQEVDDNAACIN